MLVWCHSVERIENIFSSDNFLEAICEIQAKVSLWEGPVASGDGDGDGDVETCYRCGWRQKVGPFYSTDDGAANIPA